MTKARTADEARKLTDIPNVGPATAEDLRKLGIDAPQQLCGRDPVALYRALCAMTGLRHDPCVLDVFRSAVAFMDGAPPHPWWHYTPMRKRKRKAGNGP